MRSANAAHSQRKEPDRVWEGAASRPVSLIFKGPTLGQRRNRINVFAFCRCSGEKGRKGREALLSKVETLSYLFRALRRFAFCKKETRKTLVMDFQLRGSIRGTSTDRWTMLLEIGRRYNSFLFEMNEARIWKYKEERVSSLSLKFRSIELLDEELLNRQLEGIRT